MWVGLTPRWKGVGDSYNPSPLGHQKKAGSKTKKKLKMRLKSIFIKGSKTELEHLGIVSYKVQMFYC